MKARVLVVGAERDSELMARVVQAGAAARAAALPCLEIKRDTAAIRRELFEDGKGRLDLAKLRAALPLNRLPKPVRWGKARKP